LKTSKKRDNFKRSQAEYQKFVLSDFSTLQDIHPENEGDPLENKKRADVSAKLEKLKKWSSSGHSQDHCMCVICKNGWKR
jgi:hypothetical protein